MKLPRADLLNYLRGRSMPPTHEEIATRFGLAANATSTIRRALGQLAAADLIEVTPRISRGITLTPRGRRIALEDVPLAVDIARVNEKHRRDA
jgi:Mn-dependent DtxR family transcriptional regulator